MTQGCPDYLLSCSLMYFSSEPLFIKTLYPLLGVGLVGGAFHREKLYAVYKKVIGGNMSSWQPNKSLKTSSVSGPSHKPTEAKEK